MKLIDGSLVQMMYSLEGSELRQHRLAFYPAPHLSPFSDDSESYLDDELYLDIIKRQIIPFPLRYDFDCRDGVYTDIVHPKCHLTLGDVKDCRIPVSSPVSPRFFIEFLLRNFYEVQGYSFVDGLPPHKIKFQKTITTNETKLIHIVIPE